MKCNYYVLTFLLGHKSRNIYNTLQSIDYISSLLRIELHPQKLKLLSFLHIKSEDYKKIILFLNELLLINIFG